MSCNATYDVELFDNVTKNVLWSESLTHTREECVGCIEGSISAIVYRCDNEFISLSGTIGGVDFIKTYPINSVLAEDIESSGAYKVRLKKTECECGVVDEYPEDDYFVYKVCGSEFYYYMTDDLTGTIDTSELSEEEQFAYDLRTQIIAAARSTQENSNMPVNPLYIAMILIDELERKDWLDSAQETLADMGLVSVTQSYGPAQVQPQTLASLVTAGYYPSISGYSGDLSDADQKEAIYTEIMTDEKCPAIIAAYLQRSIDWWAKGSAATGGPPDGKNSADPGFDISERPWGLLTTYAIGLTPVHDRPQGLANRWDDFSEIQSKLNRIETKLGIPKGPARYVDLMPFTSSSSEAFMCLEYVERRTERINKESGESFENSDGKTSMYLSSATVGNDALLKRAQSHCPECD
jgi:hypothetical protein